MPIPNKYFLQNQEVHLGGKMAALFQNNSLGMKKKVTRC